MFSVVSRRKGHRLSKVQAHGRRVSDLLWERMEGHLAVLPSEGNETRWEGTWGVGVRRKYL